VTTRRIEPIDHVLDVDVTVPGSKSITNRALLCASLATGTSLLRGILLADDTVVMIDGLRTLGVEIDVADGPQPEARVVGTGGRFPASNATINAGLSGTTSRFLLPAATLASGAVRVDGAAPLRARPMSDGIDALIRGGQRLESASGRLPVTVWPATSWPDRIEVNGEASSQFLSGLMLVAPALSTELEISVVGTLRSRSYVAMTIEVMRAFGATVETTPDFRHIAVTPTGYVGRDYLVEPDASAATYPWAAAAVCGGRVRVLGLGSGSIQGDVAFVDALESMGATVERHEAWIEVRGRSEVDDEVGLRGIEIDLAEESDTAQTLAAVAAFAEGPTTVSGIGFIRHKETDRIAAMVSELRRVGVHATEDDDGFTVVGGGAHGAVVQTYDDHRMAMSMALIGLRVDGIEIDDPGVVSKTFPGYWELLAQLAGLTG